MKLTLTFKRQSPRQTCQSYTVEEIVHQNLHLVQYLPRIPELLSNHAKQKISIKFPGDASGLEGIYFEDAPDEGYSLDFRYQTKTEDSYSISWESFISDIINDSKIKNTHKPNGLLLFFPIKSTISFEIISLHDKLKGFLENKPVHASGFSLSEDPLLELMKELPNIQLKVNYSGVEQGLFYSSKNGSDYRFKLQDMWIDSIRIYSTDLKKELVEFMKKDSIETNFWEKF